MEINKVRREKRRLEKVVSRLTELGPHAYACTPEHIDGKDLAHFPVRALHNERARCVRVLHARATRTLLARRACSSRSPSRML